jgi:TonB family protein
MKLHLAFCIAFLLFSVASLPAQENNVTAEPFFIGNPPLTVVPLPIPKYPKQAEKIGLGGRVTVLVTVDPLGNVTAADDVTGPHPVCKSVTDPNVLSLRAAATEAALKAKFNPPLIDGKAGGVTGRITYTFTPSATASRSTPSQGYRLDRMTTLGAQTDAATGVPILPGAVLNGTASTLPKPAFPPAARAVRATGAVGVQVLIIEDGSVHSAEAVSGHPLLRSAAEVAACSAKFTPTLLSGQPVKVSGIISYNFTQ